MASNDQQKANMTFTEEGFAAINESFTQEFGGKLGVRMAEAPIFLSKDVVDEMISSADDLIAQSTDPRVVDILKGAVPALWELKKTPAHPAFMIVDFALTEGEDGRIHPKLIEMQGAPSMYAFVQRVAETYKQVYRLGDEFRYAAGAKDEAGYIQQLRETLVGNHDPKSVILLEIEPWKQKTNMDFTATRDMLGIHVADVMDVYKKGNKLYYTDENGEEVRINRIYNRVISDEYFEQNLQDKMNFRFNDDLDVEFASDPTWQLRISKYALPFMSHPNLPKSTFVNAENLPKDLENYVLKPLFSKGGNGVVINVQQSDIDNIPVAERKDWLLMEKVRYAPVIETPAGMRKAEIRVMYTWSDDDQKAKPAILMARVMKGDLANASFNNDGWVGIAPVLWKDGANDSIATNSQGKKVQVSMG